VKEQNIGGTNCWKKFTSLDPEIGIRKIASDKMKGVWQETGLCLENTKKNGKVGEKGDDETHNEIENS
jgi:hypothetical protein